MDKTYKILVLKNRIDVPVDDDFTEAVAYFKSKGLDVSFDFQEVSQKVSIHSYKTDANGSWYGLDDYVKSDCAKIAPVGKYRAVIFAWNVLDVSPPTDGFLTSWCNYGPLSYDHMDTAFIQLITNDYNDKTDWIYLSIIHEIMHAFCSNLSRFRVFDEMDKTADGQDYLHNSDPYHPEGNFTRTFKNIEPFKDKLYEFYYNDLKKYQLLKMGDKGERVKQLQRDLKTLGYFKYPFITGTFGSITKTSVIAFQKATGLVTDGIAGPITLKAIQSALEVKKKPKVDWGLLPEVQAKADLLIEMTGNVGLKIRITEGYRTPERQAELYAQGRTKPGKIITNAKPGESSHQSRKAFDICFIGNDPYPKNDRLWKTLADLALSIGLKPGHYFTTIKDSVHFEID